MEYLTTAKLVDANKDELIASIRNIGPTPYCVIKIAKDRRIYRARYHRDPDILFSTEAELSYRTDVENINSFGRANLPGESVFYGALASGNIKQGYVSSIFETSGNLRNDTDGIERFTFSVWEATQDFEVICIITKEAAEKVGSFKKIFDGYNEFSKAHSEITEFNQIIGSEFSKKVPMGAHHEYKISAAYAHVILQGGIPGIVYPTVQGNHEGLNIVMATHAVDQFLQLKLLGVADLYKKGEHSAFDQLKIAEAQPGKVFQYTNIGSPYHLTQEQIAAILRGK